MLARKKKALSTVLKKRMLSKKRNSFQNAIFTNISDLIVSQVKQQEKEEKIETSLSNFIFAEISLSSSNSAAWWFKNFSRESVKQRKKKELKKNDWIKQKKKS